MRPTLRLLPAAALAILSAAPAIASDAGDGIRHADKQVVEQRQVVNRASQSGDAATIAAERAKLKAAQAIAWGKRHPAKTPTQKIAVK